MTTPTALDQSKFVLYWNVSKRLNHFSKRTLLIGIIVVVVAKIFRLNIHVPVLFLFTNLFAERTFHYFERKFSPLAELALRNHMRTSIKKQTFEISPKAKTETLITKIQDYLSLSNSLISNYISFFKKIVSVSKIQFRQTDDNECFIQLILKEKQSAALDVFLIDFSQKIQFSLNNAGHLKFYEPLPKQHFVNHWMFDDTFEYWTGLQFHDNKLLISSTVSQTIYNLNLIFNRN